MSRRMEYFVMGCVAGLMFGIAGGLLYAPRRGEETRRLLAVGAHRVSEVAQDVANRAESTAEVLGERVEHYLGRDHEVAWRKVREIREGVDRYTQAQAL